MDRGDLYRYLSDRLKVRGSGVVSVSDLGTLGEIEKTLVEMNDDSMVALTAATLAAILPDLDPDDVQANFDSETAEIFSALRGKTGVSVGDTLQAHGDAARMASESPNPHAVAASTAFLAAEATSTTGEGRSALADFLEIALKNVNVVGTVRDVLTRLLARCRKGAASDQQNDGHPLWIISLSIDVAASTQAKTRMRALAADQAQLAALYELFYRQFLFREDRFYRQLFDVKGRLGRPLNWRQLFVVKGIGDEIWVFYQIPEGNAEELRTAMARFLDATLALAGETILWSGGEKDAGPNFNPKIELQQRHDAMRLPFKIYLDLVADGYEISKLRGDYIAQSLNVYLNLPLTTRLGPDHIEIANRLNAGYLELAGRRLRQAYRTDYIGHEIDRFFRTTKAALPGIVTVGESLFDQLDVKYRPTAYPGLFRAEVRHKLDPQNAGSALVSRNDILFVQSVLAESEMKGIGYPYKTYHLTTLPHFRMLHYGQFADRDILAPTLAVFPEDLLEKMKTAADREREHTP